MNATTKQQSARAAPARIELIDADHQHWPQVFEMIERTGLHRRLGIEPDWVPARRSLFVAFVEDRAAGHLSFQLEPVIDGDAAQRRTRIEARVDGCGVEEGFDRDGIHRQLVAAARQRAQLLLAEAFHADGCAAT